VKNGGADVVSFLFGVYDLCTHEEATVTSTYAFCKKRNGIVLETWVLLFIFFFYIYTYILIIFNKIKLNISHLFKID
jgi:hypothetical protein